MKYERIPPMPPHDLVQEEAYAEEQTPERKGEEERDAIRLQAKMLAEELSQNPEPLPFPGLDPDEYENLKKDDAELPGYYFPIDQRIEKLQKEGMRVLVGARDGNNEIFVVPALVTTPEEIKKYRLFPRQLQITSEMDEQLERLIQLDKI
ncbi:MAG: hypothetical protein ABIT47_01795 [Candidatus Paceibacterota bacterium]